MPSLTKRSVFSSAKKRRRAILDSSEGEDEDSSSDETLTHHKSQTPSTTFQLHRRPNSSEGRSLDNSISLRRPKRPLKSSYSLEAPSDAGEKTRPIDDMKDYDTDDTGELIGSLQQSNSRISVPAAKENKQPQVDTRKEHVSLREPPVMKKPIRTIEDDTTQESSVDSVKVIESPQKEAIRVSIESHDGKQQGEDTSAQPLQQASDNHENTAPLSPSSPILGVGMNDPDEYDDASSVDTAELMRRLRPNASEQANNDDGSTSSQLKRPTAPPDEFTLPEHDSSSSEEEEEEEADDEAEHDTEPATVQRNDTVAQASSNALASMEGNSAAAGHPPPVAQAPLPRYGGPSVPSYSERIAETQKKNAPPVGPRLPPTASIATESTRHPLPVASQTNQVGPSISSVPRHSVDTRPKDGAPSLPKPPPSTSRESTRLQSQGDSEHPPAAHSLNDDELQNAAFFDTAPNSTDCPPANNVVDLCDSADEQQVPSTVREGLRSARKSPPFASRTSWDGTTTRQTPPPPVYNSAVEEDIGSFSDDQDAAAFGFGPRSSHEIPRPNLPLSQAHLPLSSQPQANAAPIHTHDHVDSSALPTNNPGMLPQPWQANTERRRRLRDATASNTSFARAVVRRDSGRPRIQPPPAAAAATTTNMSDVELQSQWTEARAVGGTSSGRPRIQPPPPPATTNMSEVEWQSQWNVARATGGAPRNDLVGGSGVGAGNYQMVQPPDDEPGWTQQPPQPAAKTKRRGKGGKQRSWKGGRWKKGGKRGGRGRGGATASRRTNRGGGVAAGSAWSDYEGGGAWSAHDSRDDPNLGHVGGAEMSF